MLKLAKIENADEIEKICKRTLQERWLYSHKDMENQSHQEGLEGKGAGCFDLCISKDRKRDLIPFHKVVFWTAHTQLDMFPKHTHTKHTHIPIINKKF